MKLYPDEAFVEKRFKKENFKVIKTDTSSKYKAPDFKLIKSKPVALVEVKQGFKKGEILSRIAETGATQFDSTPAVSDYFRNASQKFYEYTQNNQTDKKLPYILVFISPFFIREQLFWNDEPYKRYSSISAVFIPKRVHPLDYKAEEMTLEELEDLIIKQNSLFTSQISIKWDIIKNPYAVNKLNLNIFTSIHKTFYPLKQP